MRSLLPDIASVWWWKGGRLRILFGTVPDKPAAGRPVAAVFNALNIDKPARCSPLHLFPALTFSSVFVQVKSVV